METWREASVPSLPGRGREPYLADTASGRSTRAAAGQRATLYACGITPYDATHIGHAATYLAWDLLVRAWRDVGHEVVYVQNVTDVDDPLLERADRDGEDWRALAEREIARYRGDMEALRVLPPDRLIGAVEALPLIERLNQVLAERAALYDLEGDVYFSRAADPGFGAGRPGWHVECAAIATSYLGQVFDVQAGGSDLIFPHHELSASHAQVAFGDGGGAAFARCYAHSGMVRLDGEKMSKSLGNLVFVSRLVAGGADPMAVRLAIMSHHYRGDWDWTAAGLSAAAQRLARWRAAVRRAATAEPGAGAGAGPVPPARDVLAEVRERVADDLDAPGALAAVDRWAAAVLGAAALGPGAAGDAALVRDTVDGLLGVAC